MKYNLNIFVITVLPIAATGLAMNMPIKQVGIYIGIALVSQAVMWYNTK